MGESLRRFGVSSLLSYRALFTWLNPWGYASSRVVAPILIVVLFGLVAEQSGQPVLDTILGGTLLAIANSVIFGVAIAIGNERAFGTLSAWLSAPQGVGANLAGKAAVHLADGLLGAGLSLAVAALVFGTDLSGGQLLQLLLVALTVLVSASGAALLIAATSLGFRDTFTAPNVLVLLLMVLSGALVPRRGASARRGLAVEPPAGPPRRDRRGQLARARRPASRAHSRWSWRWESHGEPSPTRL